VATEKSVPLPIARTAAELYRLPVVQGHGEHEPSVLIDLLEGKR
jgi:3-hydroxyisobutyrate dehydrogenase-like beta-hydroxyacid dehydrogenase